MAQPKRIADEPAFVLHSYDWSESSLILETFTRHYGRVALVAKGAKKPSSNFRPVLLPLQPLQLTYTLAGSGDADIHALKGAEWVGGHVMPTGDALLSGYYLNELLLRLLARDDPHPGLFDAYAAVVQVLAGHGSPTGITPALQGEVLHVALRAFELLLLREIGLLPVLDAQTLTLEPLAPDDHYCLVPEGGLREAHEDDRAALSGTAWVSLQSALGEGAGFASVLRASGPVMAELRPQLRALLNYHCGVATLRTRQMMMDLQSL